MPRVHIRWTNQMSQMSLKIQVVKNPSNKILEFLKCFGIPTRKTCSKIQVVKNPSKKLMSKKSD